MCNVPGTGGYKTMCRDGQIMYKRNSTHQELLEPPRLSKDLISDYRVLDQLIGLPEIAKATGASIISLDSMFRMSNLINYDGRLDLIKYNKFIQLRTKVYRQHDPKKILKMRSTLREVKNYNKNPISIEALKHAKSDKKNNTIEPGIHDSLNNRPNGSGHRHVFTEDLHFRLTAKLNNIGIKVLAQKINYSVRQTNRILKPNHIGKSIDPFKGSRLIQYAMSVEDISMTI